DPATLRSWTPDSPFWRRLATPCHEPSPRHRLRQSDTVHLPPARDEGYTNSARYLYRSAATSPLAGRPSSERRAFSGSVRPPRIPWEPGCGCRVPLGFGRDRRQTEWLASG